MQEIEFGENENGTYEKYPSGLLICRQTVSVGMSEGTGALFRSDAQLWEFPHEFISSDISVTFTTRVANRWGGTTGAINTDRVRSEERRVGRECRSQWWACEWWNSSGGETVRIRSIAKI